jgi:hypothetical protein
MIKETLDANNGNPKSMLLKFVKRTRKANIQKRGKAIKFRSPKLSPLRRKRKAMMRIKWENEQYLKRKTAKL